MKYLKSFVTVLLTFMLWGCTSAGTVPETTLPTTTPVTEATEAPIPETTVPPVTEPPVETTIPEPEPTEYVLSFAGDCCLANQKGWSETQYFRGTVGENYAYPFAGVVDIFAEDDCTFINLENPLTDSQTPMNKPFVFKGPTAYTQILTLGSVEFANVVNNHAMDYREEGYLDTLEALDQAEILYCEQGQNVIFTTESGLTIGLHAQLYPEDTEALCQAVADLRRDGAELVIVCLHWGQEYYYKPLASQKEMAHAVIDAGADILYGHHSHVLQPIEHYQDGVIFYSLGNFCFGGNTNPQDKDSAILQQTVIRDVDGTIRLGELKIIPCSVSSTASYNDFQPTILEPDTDAYDRVLRKLDGTYEKNRLIPSNRPDLG